MNPKTRKKYSIGFVVVTDDLTPLLGARTAQQLELITVHEDHFISAPPPQKKSSEDIRSITTADELVRRYPEVFAKDRAPVAHLVVHWAETREVVSSRLRPDQHSGSLNN